MATCKCGTVNEYADEVEYGKDGYECYVCRDSRGAVKVGDPRILAVDPGAEPGVVAWWKGPSIANALKYREAGLKRTCAPWQPDAAAVAAVEKEILDLVLTGRYGMMNTKLPDLLKKHAELKFSPEARLEVEDLLEELEDSARAAQEAIDKVPDALRYEYQTRFYSATESK